MTPRETNAALNGYAKRMKSEHKAQMRYAWHNAYLHRVPDFPALDDYVPPEDVPKAQGLSPDVGLSILAATQRALNKRANR